jgi:hypothetical protein
MNLNFKIPTEWFKLAEKSSYLLKDDIEEIKENLNNINNYEFINELKLYDSNEERKEQEYNKIMIVYYYDLIKIIKFYEKAIENKEYNKLVSENKPLIYMGSDHICCPISNDIIEEGDEIYLLFFKEDNKTLFYIIKKDNFYEYVKLKYIEDCDYMIEDKYIPTELIFERWQKRIYNDRIERNKSKRLINEVLEYYNDLNKKISISLING